MGWALRHPCSHDSAGGVSTENETCRRENHGDWARLRRDLSFHCRYSATAGQTTGRDGLNCSIDDTFKLCPPHRQDSLVRALHLSLPLHPQTQPVRLSGRQHLASLVTQSAAPNEHPRPVKRLLSGDRQSPSPRFAVLGTLRRRTHRRMSGRHTAQGTSRADYVKTFLLPRSVSPVIER